MSRDAHLHGLRALARLRAVVGAGPARPGARLRAVVGARPPRAVARLWAIVGAWRWIAVAALASCLAGFAGVPAGAGAVRHAPAVAAAGGPEGALAAGAVTWQRPVAGAVTRRFLMHGSPFAAGQHRGVDLAAAPGAPVGAPCGGRVVVAAPIGSSGGVVTVACGPWRASVLPLRRIDVSRGRVVRAGEPVGTADRSLAHAGIHLGVRRAGDRFGYVDPLRFLGDHSPRRVAPPVIDPRPRRPTAIRAPAPRPLPVRAPIVAPPPAPAAPHPLAGAAPGSGLPVAAWPAWLGVALLLAAASGGVVRARRTRRGAPHPAIAQERAI